MTPNSLAFDHWIRNRFVELNTELELIYKNQNERINVNQVGDQIKKTLEDFAGKKEIGFGKLLGLLRISLVGKLAGADLFEIMKLLGKKTVLKRLLFLSNYIG